MDVRPDKSEASPDGRLRVDYFVDSGLMSHEIDSPTLVDVSTGECLFALGYPWSATTAFGSGGEVTFELRHYPNGATVIRVAIDTRRREGRIDGGEPVPLAALSSAIRKRYEDLVPAASEKRYAFEQAKSRIAVAFFLVAVVAAMFLFADRVRQWFSATSPAPAAKPLATVPKPTTVPIQDTRKPEDRGAPRP